MDLVLMIEHLSRIYPVIAWQQGHLGEIAVAAGALGYECGIGWREGCDLSAAANAHQNSPSSGRRAARPVFVERLGRSIPKRSLLCLREHRDLWTRILCLDPDCCPPGGAGLFGDARAHAVVQRARRLHQIARIDRPVWRWQHLADAADDGLDLATRINRYAQAEPALTQVNSHALVAVSAVSHTRRTDIRSRRVA
jgi:hypothetical protein